MKAFVGLCAVLTACGFEHGARPNVGGPDDGGIDALVDAGPDAMPDALDPNCFGKGSFYFCLTALPTQPLSINSNIDSDTDEDPATCDGGRGVVMTVGGASSCVLAGTNIAFNGSTVGSSGDKPIVFVATGNISLTTTQTLDARSASTGGGPGMNPTDCGDAPSGAAGVGGGGGGAGGSFGTKGGDGGDGGFGSGGVGAGGVAKPAVTQPVTKLRGGCPGGSGAGPFASQGGAGGGAVYFVARGTIQIDGTVTVAGAGGVGGQSARGGGGGGGSGGMIVLHGGTISIGTSARLFANGGGGGGGAGTASDGGAGDDSTFMTTAAGGGTAGGGATTGGAGAVRTTPAVSAADAQQGGGGGGGGVGVIRVLSGQTVNATTFSPAPST